MDSKEKTNFPQKIIIHKSKRHPRKARSSRRTSCPTILSLEPEFVQEGNSDPFSRDDPKHIYIPFSLVSREKFSCDLDREAFLMCRGECSLTLSYLEFTFPFICSLKGLYICLDDYCRAPFIHLSFSVCREFRKTRIFEFPEPKHKYEWFFLPIDLNDVIDCEIKVMEQNKDGSSKSTSSKIHSLAFFRKEIPTECSVRRRLESQWSKAHVVPSKFLGPGNGSSIPIPRYDPSIINPLFSKVEGKIERMHLERDESLNAQKMLKGEGDVKLSYLSIPFLISFPIKGAYICVTKTHSSPSLFFIFTDYDGKKIFRKYDFRELIHESEWFFLPIDLSNIVSCEIYGNGRWDPKKNIIFSLSSLIFTVAAEILEAERLSLLPWEPKMK
ncbi:hypothetical protein ADUPG1_007676 [Aduncisulcus paluster]|uniref:Uncharacterized protein n=1 Tax=Aduncisulcus paluster TaxID=2918883 RepID=A0ABQ5KSD0_9EUKA|nr:hypothetical protein ADUPG1_007676 [Aduncisulcus paluster]